MGEEIDAGLVRVAEIESSATFLNDGPHLQSVREPAMGADGLGAVDHGQAPAPRTALAAVRMLSLVALRPATVTTVFPVRQVREDHSSSTIRL